MSVSSMALETARVTTEAQGMVRRFIILGQQRERFGLSRESAWRAAVVTFTPKFAQVLWNACYQCPYPDVNQS